MNIYGATTLPLPLEFDCDKHDWGDGICRPLLRVSLL